LVSDEYGDSFLNIIFAPESKIEHSESICSTSWQGFGLFMLQIKTSDSHWPKNLF